MHDISVERKLAIALILLTSLSVGSTAALWNSNVRFRIDSPLTKSTEPVLVSSLGSPFAASNSTLPSWTMGAAIPSSREGYGAAEVKGIFYYIAGYGQFGDGTTNEAYTPANDSWTTKAPLPSSPRSETVAVTDGTSIYLIGGRPVSIVGHDLWRYSPSNDTWKSLAPLPTARATEHMAAFYNGNIYVIGGRTTDEPTGGGDLAVVEIYSIASNSWTTGTPLPAPLADAYTVLFNGRIYVFGGDTVNGTANTNTYIYDITSNSWTTGAISPAGLVDPAVAICGSLIYVIGGSTTNLVLQNSNYAYNPTSDTWNSSLNIPTRTAEVQAISYAGRIYIISGGIFGSGGFNPTNQIFHCADNTLYVSPSHLSVQPPGSIVVYKVKVANTQPFTSWDIMVRTNQSVINPQSVSITGNLFAANFSRTVTELTNCVNGSGMGCKGSDGPGIVHSSATVSGVAPNATLNGLLFMISYRAVGGTYSAVGLLNDSLTLGACCPLSHFSVDGVYGQPPPNFSISAFPAHTIIGQLSTGSASIILTGLNNFTGKVNLSGTVSPPGPLLSFTPSPVSVVGNKSSTSVLTISPTGSTSLGNYTITVTATSGSLTHTARLTITIVPDFSITANPTSFTAPAGVIVSSTITLKSEGFSGFLFLSTTVTPIVANSPGTQLNTTFVALSPSSSQNVQLLIGAFTQTPPGNYSITVTATDTISHSVTVLFTVLAPSISLTPSSGTIGTEVIVRGSNLPRFFFETQTSVVVSFDDMFVGNAIVTNGSFTFVLNVPNVQPGSHFIKAQDFNTLVQVNASFLVLPNPSALGVDVEVGTIYFPGDTAVASVLVTQDGTLVNAASITLTVQLVRPDGLVIPLNVSSISTGLFKATYKIPSIGPIGVYAIKVTAKSSAGSSGIGLGSFEVKLTWLSSQVRNIAGGITVTSTIGLAALAWRRGYFRRKDPQDS